MNEFAVKVTTDGDLFFIYKDNHPLLELGPLEVTRASNVEFDSDRQEWIVVLNFPDGSRARLPEGHKNRTAAIAYEVEVLIDLLMKDQVNPEQYFHKKEEDSVGLTVLSGRG